MGRKQKNAMYENAIMQLIDNDNAGKKTISVTLPESLIKDLDYIAGELTGGNRSLVCEKGLIEFAAACKEYISKERKKKVTETENTID